MDTKSSSVQGTTQKVELIQDNTGKSAPVPNTRTSAVEILDVYGKKLKYVVIENAWGKVIISVGEKTYNNIKELTK